MSDADPLQRLRIWLVKCRRHVHPPSVTEIGDMIGLAISEIERMRGVVERLQPSAERNSVELEPTVTGRPTRVSGGMAR